MDFTDDQIKELTREELIAMVLEVRQAVSTENYDDVKEKSDYPADYIRGEVSAVVGKELNF